jgi:hypothetical protein
LIATEWVFVATILVLGIVTGLVAVRSAVISELDDFANALLALNQSFSFSGQSNCQSSSAGSAFLDVGSVCIDTARVAATPSGCDSDPCD